MTESKPEERCETCKYWSRHGDVLPGECRRFPPIGDGTHTPANGWCGEYKKRSPLAQPLAAGPTTIVNTMGEYPPDTDLANT